METKVCTKCPPEEAEKPLSEFRVIRSKKGTWTSGKCRDCERKSAKAFYQRHVDELSEKRKERYAREREQVREYHRARYAANPEKYRGLARKYYQQDPKARLEVQRQRRLANPERTKELNRASYLRNREQKLARQREMRRNRTREQRRLDYQRDRKSILAHYHRNKEHYHENNRRWRIQNPLKNAEKAAKYRARQQAAPIIDIVHREDIIVRDQSTCYLCGRVLDMHEITLDHVVSLYAGGSHTASNLRVCCGPCNSSKGSKSLDEYIAWKANLDP